MHVQGVSSSTCIYMDNGENIEVNMTIGCYLT